MSDFKIKVQPNGPLIVTGKFKLELQNGTVEEKETATLCRCGHSQNKPFCDGSHRKVGFEG